MNRARRFVRRVYRGIGRRAFSAYNFAGDRVECCLCQWKGRRFLPAGDAWRGERLCPSCGSLERYRAMFLYLREFGGLGERPLTLLEVAPKACFATRCGSLPGVRYLSTDLLSHDAAVLSDLTMFSFATGAIDVLVCSHVMEHVPDDVAAFKEIGRVLKPDGFALVMVPLIAGPTFEDPDAGPEDYERLYGQFDHVRSYGLDVVDRMAASGLVAKAIDLFETFDPSTLGRHGLLGDDRFLFRVSKGLNGAPLASPEASPGGFV
ncbi:MAG: methyltransferase domain-containing protein [Isosphaeraceae bacterium]